MKTIASLIIFVLGCSFCWGQQLPDGNYLIPVDHKIENLRHGKISAMYRADIITLLGAVYQGYVIVDAYRYEYNRNYIYSQNDFRVDVDGFVYADSKLDKKAEPFLVLMGGDSAIHISKEYYENPKKHFGSQKVGGIFLDGGTEWAYHILNVKEVEKTGDIYTGKDTGLWDDGIKILTAWSTLTEKTKGGVTSYSADRMRHPFYAWGDMDLNFNNASLFWAEGEPGPGIGGKIEVEFTRDADHVMVLNGAVDLARRYLYKANNRLKRVLIESEEPRFSIEYTFEDIVQFHKIDLPKKTRKITLTIKEVYKGEKWDDTCVSAIFLKQEELQPRAEYEKIIEEYIKLKGFDKLIEEYKVRKLEKISR